MSENSTTEVTSVENSSNVENVEGETSSISDLPQIIEDLKTNGLKITTLYDVFNVVANISKKLYGGSAEEGESEADFDNRVAPLIVEFLVTFNLITRASADGAKKFIMSSLHVGVDAIEEVINVDIDGDGKVGFVAGDENQNLLLRINNKLEQIIDMDINNDGQVAGKAKSGNKKCIML